MVTHEFFPIHGEDGRKGRDRLPHSSGGSSISGYKTFLICLGAQKAGTTWLWRYLLGHPQCAVTPLKELHFFDKGNLRLIKLLKEVELEIPGAKDPEEIAFLRDKHHFISHAVELYSRPERTAEDFEKLVSSIATPEARVVAEFTPANGLLKTQQLKALAGLPIAPKFVLILRDPVDRMWSQIRMLAARREQDPNKVCEIGRASCRERV